jgi:hypothetical protein
MNIEITKDQLREIQKHRGELDTDSGMRFVGVIAQYNQATKFFVGKAVLDGEVDACSGSFSLNSILSTEVADSSVEYWENKDADN